MSKIKALLVLTAMAAVMLLLHACSTRSVTTTGAVARTQCVTVPAVPLVPAGAVSLRLKRVGECAVDPESVSFEFNPDSKPCQLDSKPENTFSPMIVDAGKAYCSGTSDFCARCIKVYDFTVIKQEFACVEYAATAKTSRFSNPRPVRFLQCIKNDGSNCNAEVDCREAIDALGSEKVAKAK